jgi:transcription elongation GreA/GreB family factor
VALTKRPGYVQLKEADLSVAFTKDSAETASETLLPDRPVSPHPNLVTEAGLKALEFQLHQAREAYETAQKIEDVNERRRQAAIPLRDMRYFAVRVRTAQVITNPASTDTVAFGSTVTFRRGDGRVQKYLIVGEDEADPRPILFPSYPQWQDASTARMRLAPASRARRRDVALPASAARRAAPE